MPRTYSEQFGELDYAEDSAILFPGGLPGFEQCRRFVLMDNPRHAPLVHLQSIEDPALCFLAVPVRLVDAEYQTTLSEEDAGLLGTPATVLELALLSATDEGNLTANLLAPIVIDLATRRAVQAVRGDARYSHQHPVEVLCS